MTTKAINADGNLVDWPDFPDLALRRPATGPVTQAFGITSVTGIIHKGIDVSVSQGTPIRAVKAGRVVYTYKNGRDMPGLATDGSPGGYGNQVYIDHGSGFTTRYAHLMVGGVLVEVGEEVDAGETLGLAGSTGISTGPHLHWEIRSWNLPFDAAQYQTLMPEPLVRAADVSSYQGLVSQQWWQMMRERYGVRLAIIAAHDGGAGVNPHAARGLELAQKAGCKIASYCWPPAALGAALDNVAMHHDDLLFVALDEEAGQNIYPSQLEAIREKGIQPFVYTSQSQWSDGMDASATPLWDAQYYSYWDQWRWPGDGDLTGAYVRYGGWERRHGWQQRGDIIVEGVNCDLDVFVEDVLLTEQRVREMIDDALRAANNQHYSDDHQYLKPAAEAAKAAGLTYEDRENPAYTRFLRRGEQWDRQLMRTVEDINLQPTTKDTLKRVALDLQELAQGD